VESGLWGKPTVINNVETLCAIPAIVARGGAWFAALGRGFGTKLFGLGAAAVAPLLATTNVFADMGDQLAKMSARTDAKGSLGRG
jgi:NADH:ubiquinone oxidoreductase subunit F (NADH-binding)